MGGGALRAARAQRRKMASMAPLAVIGM